MTQRPDTNIWLRKQADLVNNEIVVLLASLSDTVGFCDIIRESLTGVRRGIGYETERYKPWYLLPAVVCEAISGYCEHAAPASAALQLFMAAGEVFDDIEDADAPGSLFARYGTAIATNAATALVILAERAISRLKEKGVADCIIVSVVAAVNSFYSVACAGQHLDLSLSDVSEDMYLRIASMKSASTTECACHIGALLATANQALTDSFTLFGYNLGMASQIANDIHGIISRRDIIDHKITLPVVYALAHTEGETYNQLESAFKRQPESNCDLMETTALLFNSGAVHYSMIKMETYKQHALDILDELENTGYDVKKLKLFL